MTGPDTGPDSPASPADTVSGGTENGEIRLDTVQTEPAVLLPNAGHGPADFGGVTTSTSVLGLSWSSTERMSAQQADLLTTEITAIRRALTPTVERICRMWLRMHGFTCGYEVVWDDINLQDEVEEAKAQLYLEQARKLRIENDAAEGIRAAEGTT